MLASKCCDTGVQAGQYFRENNCRARFSNCFVLKFDDAQRSISYGLLCTAWEDKNPEEFVEEFKSMFTDDKVGGGYAISQI